MPAAYSEAVSRPGGQSSKPASWPGTLVSRLHARLRALLHRLGLCYCGRPATSSEDMTCGLSPVPIRASLELGAARRPSITLPNTGSGPRLPSWRCVRGRGISAGAAPAQASSRAASRPQADALALGAQVVVGGRAGHDSGRLDALLLHPPLGGRLLPAASTTPLAQGCWVGWLVHLPAGLLPVHGWGCSELHAAPLPR